MNSENLHLVNMNAFIISYLLSKIE